MNSRNYLGLVGALLLAAGGLSPMVHLPIIGNWNYWDLHPGLATVVYVLAALGIFAAISGKGGLLKFVGWTEFFLILLTLAAVYFKVNDSFSFIPLKSLARAAAGLVHYRWIGWAMLLLGALIMIFSAKKQKAS
ncbi:hypothetical protein [Arcticibacter sp. MXS-1]|uniref:hypothetical protein n=1 Tax=Arcticibacter sp. MXS-1 TaxID=3341726 RepID=UPI0035A898C5